MLSSSQPILGSGMARALDQRAAREFKINPTSNQRKSSVRALKRLKRLTSQQVLAAAAITTFAVAVTVGTGGIGAPAAAALTVSALVLLNKVNAVAKKELKVIDKEIKKEKRELKNIAEQKVKLNHSLLQHSRESREKERVDAYKYILGSVRSPNANSTEVIKKLESYLQQLKKDTDSLESEFENMATIDVTKEPAERTLQGALSISDELDELQLALKRAGLDSKISDFHNQIHLELDKLAKVYDKGITKMKSSVDVNKVFNRGASDDGMAAYAKASDNQINSGIKAEDNVPIPPLGTGAPETGLTPTK